jgi:outer membrane biogenesis lipoprotein LolB
MKKIFDWIGENYARIFMFLCLAALLVTAFIPMDKKQNVQLKDYKDGIQNHLAWDIKGQCFFVRPNDDVTVYLIRVADCDKK